MTVSKFGSLIISTALLITGLIFLAAPADTATYQYHINKCLDT